MCSRLRCYVGAFVAFALGRPALSAETTAIDPVWLAKAKTELHSLHDKYLIIASRLDESSEIRADKAPGSTGTIPFYPQTRREHVIRSGESIMRERIRILDHQSDSPVIRLACDNADYYFTLQKSKEEAPYSLVEYSPGKRQYPLTEERPALQDYLFSHLPDALDALNKRGTKTLRSVHFDEGRKLLSIDFSFTDETISIREQQYHDPNQEWRLVELRRETDSSISTEHYSYGKRLNGVMLATGLTNRVNYKVANAPPNMVTTFKVLSLRVTDKTADDFRLSAFGFPEPVDVPTRAKPTRWYLWILLAAGVCGALSLGFAWLRRRCVPDAAAALRGTA
jgi:hypothetical protein